MQAAILKASAKATLREVTDDPWTLAALTLGTFLTAFLVSAHACCLDLEPSQFSTLISICTSAG